MMIQRGMKQDASTHSRMLIEKAISDQFAQHVPEKHGARKNLVPGKTWDSRRHNSCPLREWLSETYNTKFLTL
ncbi:hypothetical protein Mal48_13530 [Thalassoglobus polymorphus]|uniref:Uncharacterized protein n=1 Tax=Thalassoglobus polymorphus TaxID=2527994 RepID=A0A517QKE1_9PLAN|nr:hypothetical protein Mal48_13530 [Thalassoglobus polymorphus]